MAPNTLYLGDNLDILGRYLAEESVDLIYLDPPFNSNADYHASLATQDGAPIPAFPDTWEWNTESAQAYAAFVADARVPEPARRALVAFRDLLGPSNMLAYLAMMAPRLDALRRVLKPTGSLYLHCDPTASHFLKLLLNGVFGADRCRNEITWKRTHSHGSAKRYGPVHDTILFYTKSDSWYWSDPRMPHGPTYLKQHFRQRDLATGRCFQAITLTGAGIRHGASGKPWRGIDPTAVQRHWAIPGAVIKRLGIAGGTAQDKLDALDRMGRIYWPEKRGGTPRLKWFSDELEGVSLPDVWTDIPPLSAQAAERVGYPTQKPRALLERIIEASSREGDLVLDPFCGCGTTIAAAQQLHRRWIGIEISSLATALIQSRLRDLYGSGIARTYDVVGPAPVTVTGP